MVKLPKEEFVKLYLLKIEGIANNIKKSEESIRRYEKNHLNWLKQENFGKKERLYQYIKELLININIRYHYEFDDEMEEKFNLSVLDFSSLNLTQIIDYCEKLGVFLAKIENTETYKKNPFDKEYIEKLKTIIDESISHIRNAEAEIADIERELSSDDFSDKQLQKQQHLLDLQKDLEAAIRTILLAAEARIREASDEEINQERQKVINEHEAIVKSLEEQLNEIIPRINANLSDEDLKDLLAEKDNIEWQIKQAKEIIEKYQSIDIKTLKDILIKHLQTTAFKKIDWKSFLDTDKAPTFEETSSYAKDLYERVSKAGINPQNIVFAKIAGNPKAREDILPIANKYNGLIAKKDEVKDVKFSLSEIDKLIKDSFPSLKDSFYADEYIAFFCEWVNISAGKESVDGVIKAISDKMEELKKVDEEFAKKYHPFIHSFYSKDPKDESKTIISADFLDALEETKDFIGAERYDELKEQYNNFQKSRKNIFIRIFNKKKIAKGQTKLIEDTTSIHTMIEEKISKEKALAKLGEYLKKTKDQATPENISLLDYMDEIAKGFGSFFEKVKTAGEAKKTESQTEISKIDRALDEIINYIKDNYGIEINPEDREMIFPQSEGYLTGKDIEEAEKKYRDEVAALNMIKNAQSESFEMGSR